MSAPAAERFALDHLPLRPWKNGGGSTREIAAFPPGAGNGDFGWRLSLAEVAQDGPFSAFPGVDRQIVLWRGAGLQLRDGRSIDHRLVRPGEPFAFEGEAPMGATLLAGPTWDLNVMTRRGGWRAEVRAVRAAGRVAPAEAALLLCGAGTWRISGEARALGADDGCLWRAACGALAVDPLDGVDPWLVVVRLCHDRRP